MKTLPILRYSGWWLGLSLTLIAASLIALGTLGLQWSIDFSGGSLVEVRTSSAQSTEELRAHVAESGFEATVQKGEGDAYLIRLPVVSEEEHQRIIGTLQTAYPDVTETQFTAVGPTVGAELKRATVFAIIILLALIGLYVAWAFRKVSEPVPSWKYGIATLIASFHDVIIPLGIFAILGHVWGYQVDTSFVAAILTILGYSINDTIVVFDRTRENLLRHRDSQDFRAIVNASVNETLNRSFNTTIATLLPLLAIFIVGGETTRPFVLALIIGILAGAFSSIFLASPLLVLWHEWSAKKK